MLPPTNSPDGTYKEQPIFDFDAEHHGISARKRSDLDIEFLNEEEDVFPLPNVRHRRQNEEEGRLLSQSAFNRITETLGALNKVGSFFLNMTREVNGEQGHRGDMQLISSSSSLSSTLSTKKPTISTTTGVFSTDLSTTTQKTENITRTTEGISKRIGLSQTEKYPQLDTQTLNEKIDIAALAEKKRKKHQAIPSKKETIAPNPTVSSALTPGNLSTVENVADCVD